MALTLSALVVTLAVAVPAAADEFAASYCEGGSRYPVAMVDDVHRPGFNGRLYVRRPVIGGVNAWAVASGNPGADYYGASGADGITVGLCYEPIRPFDGAGYGVISPWDVVNDRAYRRNPYTNAYSRARDKAADRLEAARQDWLRDNGYTGGVRTHVNDAALLGLMNDTDGREASLPTPRATIRLPEDAPRLKRNMRVEGPARISLPPSAPAELARRLDRTDGVINPPGNDGTVIAIRD